MIWDGIRYETIFGKIILPGVGTAITAIGAVLIAFPAVNEFIQGPVLAAGENFRLPVRVRLDARHASAIPL